MRYLKTYEGLTKWGPFYSKLKELFSIIGYSGYNFPYMGTGPRFTVNFNLISIPGSISYCIIQKRMQEYNDPEITNLYENPEGSLFPRNNDGIADDKHLFPVEGEPNEAYTKIITAAIEIIKPLQKIRVHTATDTYIPEIIELQTILLNNNIDYNKEIIIPKEVCDKLIMYIQGYKKPHKLMFDMQKNVPLLYTEIKNIFGDNKLDNSAEMHDMGFSD